MSTSANFKNNINRVRELLRTHSDGLTMVEVIQITGLTYSCAYKAVERLRWVYVDRWTPDLRTSKWVPVYCMSSEPEADAPKPDIKVSDYLKARSSPWKAVTRFDQLKPGDTVRFKSRAEVTGQYRGRGLDMAVVYVTHEALKGAPRDVLCKLKEIEVEESA